MYVINCHQSPEFEVEEADERSTNAELCKCGVEATNKLHSQQRFHRCFHYIVTFLFVSMIVSNVIFNCSLKVWNVHSTGVWKEEKAHICSGVCYQSFPKPFCPHIYI